MIHCYDHPKWREYGERLLRTVVGRYRDRENLLIWGVWDGASFPTTDGPVCPCYCASTLDRYAAWLKRRYTLAELNERLHRRYRCWEDVAPRAQRPQRRGDAALPAVPRGQPRRDAALAGGG